MSGVVRAQEVEWRGWRLIAKAMQPFGVVKSSARAHLPIIACG
ncbi:MAG TPA: hypothetical protein VMR20_13110 [Verrucomicrobiae bacterium]|nr:hypothetical protein [Verrucomicrobiae bacterium]